MLEQMKLQREEMAIQREAMEIQREEQGKLQREELAIQREQFETLVHRLTTAPTQAAVTTNQVSNVAIPNFMAFDATSELWKDYWSRFQTFSQANSVPTERLPQVFLTNQTAATYKLLSTLAGQQTPPVQIHALAMSDIEDFMHTQYDPNRFIVREHFKFWSDMQRKPGETIQELAARVRQDAARCDFASIKDPQDEAMRTRFMCSVNNEAVLKALFKIPSEELPFARAVKIALETEDAAKAAKETVYGGRKEPVLKVQAKSKPRFQKQSDKRKPDFPKGTCPRCGKTSHRADDCRFKDSECNFCHKKGHIEKVCLGKKRQAEEKVSLITAKPIIVINNIDREDREPLFKHLLFQEKKFTFLVDTGSGDSFCETAIWKQVGKPKLKEPSFQYVGVGGKPLQVLGQFSYPVRTSSSNSEYVVNFVVTEDKLNLLGRKALRQLDIDVNELLKAPHASPHAHVSKVNVVSVNKGDDTTLHVECEKLCRQFKDLFKPELGCLKDVELEVQFKSDAKPVFHKARTVPLALLDDLNQAYDAGVKRGIWQPTQFNDYGTPVVPIRKALIQGQQKSKLRVCGDYSGTVNPQLETHRHPIPLPEDLMRKLGGGHFFTKIDLADAYNQIRLAPESQRRLALSTHKGVLLQTRLPFGISSAPGYFQEIIDRLTCDLNGVAVYLDDILVSGADSTEHIENLRALLQRLQEKGLRCRLEKCSFAQPTVEYLGHILSLQGVSKGSKVDAVLQMPAPTDVPSLRSFLGAVQFYGKFLKDHSTMSEPLTKLTRKDTAWCWGAQQQTAFQRIKDALCAETVLAHYDATADIGISCDASEVGIGVVLFHRFKDGSERPISNASKTLTPTQKRYSQIQKEALAVIFGLKKFHQYLYGRRFILVTDHKPLISLFSPSKATPVMAANRLARWALMLNAYDYTVEYRPTRLHGNADALSRLPSGEDAHFDLDEEQADVSTVCSVTQLGRQLDPVKPQLLAKESSKDPVISKVLRYVKEGWPNTSEENLRHFRKLSDSLTTENGCLFFGARIVIPSSVQPQVLELLHLGHCGMQRMKQLARSVVYWPHIDEEIEKLVQSCTSCAEHQNAPPKPANHPWMLPEKPWSRLHIDHAINFLGSNWLVLVDAYSKYPCIHMTSSVSAKSTTNILEQEFAHFGYPHTLVTDNAQAFHSDEFQAWCRERGITHLTGAPYHPATNGAAERLVQSFKQSLRKSLLPPKAALNEFLMQYRRTPLTSGYSPSELLNGRQLRCKLDALVPSPAHVAQGKQAKEAMKTQCSEKTKVVGSTTYAYTVGAPCYALYCGPKRNKDPRWIPAVVVKVFGTRSVHVRVLPRGPIWRRHITQLRPRYGADHDADPGEEPTCSTENNTLGDASKTVPASQPRPRRNPRLPNDDTYSRENPRRSTRARKPPQK